MKIFVPLVGQHENVGDVVLRRELAEWLAPEGQLHVFVGRSTDSYDEALELPTSAVLYRNVGVWARALIRALFSSADVAYVYKPGEIQLTFPGLKEHLGLLPLVLATRARGGVVVRVGAGSRNFEWVPVAVVRATLRLSHLIAWRDPRTAQMLGHGRIMPDLGFGQTGRSAPIGPPRGRLTVTMRGDREAPSENWRRAIQSTARELGLRLTVITQVKRDERLSAELAAQWDADYIPWNVLGHGDQEAAVRRVFAESELVVSDRLHALIIAVTEGAAVAAVADDPSDKVARHFEAAGIPIICVDAGTVPAEAITALLGDTVGKRLTQQDALSETLERLRAVHTNMTSVLRRRHA